MSGQRIRLREALVPADVAAIAAMVAATGFFSPAEEAIAMELAQESLAQGAEASGYHFVLADDAAAGALLGYACLGPTPGAEGTYDLYWIVVDPAAQGRGLGRLLLEAAAAMARSAGGRLLFAETSGRPQYAATRRFYEACSFVAEAVLKDFYRPGDDKLIYRLGL